MKRSVIEEGAKDNLPPDNQIIKGQYKGKGTFIDPPISFDEFRTFLAKCLTDTCVTDEAFEKPMWKKHGERGLEYALEDLGKIMRRAHRRGNKVIFIGNGGSSAIASHMAVDYSKNGGIRSIAFNDAPTLTCLANDYGYEHVFAKQLEFYARKGDVVVIVSSSGKSPNILRAAEQAQAMGLDLVTFTGMNPDNGLRRMGSMNFYTACSDYGLVELTHLSLLHSIVSIA